MGSEGQQVGSEGQPEGFEDQENEDGCAYERADRQREFLPSQKKIVSY